MTENLLKFSQQVRQEANKCHQETSDAHRVWSKHIKITGFDFTAENWALIPNGPAVSKNQASAAWD